MKAYHLLMFIFLGFTVTCLAEELCPKNVRVLNKETNKKIEVFAKCGTGEWISLPAGQTGTYSVGTQPSDGITIRTLVDGKRIQLWSGSSMPPDGVTLRCYDLTDPGEARAAGKPMRCDPITSF